MEVVPVYHNPSYHIVKVKVDSDSYITYTRNISTGEELMEYYRGNNYVPDSNKRSYSRVYSAELIPAKYREFWNIGKAFYEKEFIKK